MPLTARTPSLAHQLMPVYAQLTLYQIREKPATPHPVRGCRGHMVSAARTALEALKLEPSSVKRLKAAVLTPRSVYKLSRLRKTYATPRNAESTNSMWGHGLVFALHVVVGPKHALCNARTKQEPLSHKCFACRIQTQRPQELNSRVITGPANGNLASGEIVRQSVMAEFEKEL